MISLDVADLVVIAGRTLGVDTDVALGQLDVAAAQAALAEARSVGRWQRGGPGDRSSAAEAGIGVVQALLRHRPFPRHGERVAVAAGLQFLALNGWRADLDPPATAAVVVEALASGRLSADNAAAWLSPRLSPRRTTETAAVRVPRRGPQPGSAPARGHARGGRTLVSAALAAVLGSLALLATACSQGPVMSGAPPVDRHSTVQQSRIPSQGSVEAARDFSACMRSNGVATFPEPSTGAVIVITATAGLDVSSSQFRAAERTCYREVPIAPAQVVTASKR